jgi:DUF1009 family protein
MPSTKGRREDASDVPLLTPQDTIGLIAGNGAFPLLVLEEARRRGLRVVVLAVKGEAESRIDDTDAAAVHWIGLGEVSRCIKILKQEGVSQAIMAGQIKHKKVFSLLRPDPALLRVWSRMKTRNTDAILGAVADVLAEEGIALMDSTALLRPWMASAGVLGSRSPSAEEERDIAFGFHAARELARLDIGQTVVVKGGAVVAAEAMEGTDETIRRAGSLVSGGLTVVKVARPAQDMRFDVPVVGPRTIEVMGQAGCSVLALQAEMSLLLERDVFLEMADRQGIVVFGAEAPPDEIGKEPPE